MPVASRSLLRRYYAISFVANLSFALPIWVLFGHDYLGLSWMGGIALVALPDLVTSVLNIPAGALADRWGRSRTYRVGLVLSIGASLPFALTQDIVTLVFFTLIGGIGFSLSAGCLDAIVSTALDGADKYRRATSNQRTFFFLARCAGGVAGTQLYAIDERLPMVAVALSVLVCLAISTGLPSTRLAQVTKHDESNRAVMSEAITLFRTNPSLRALFVLVAVFDIAGNMTYIGYQPALQRSGFDESHFGLLFMTFSAFSVLGSQLVKPLMRMYTPAVILRGLFVATMVTALGLAFTQRWVMYALTIPLQFGFGTLFPLSMSYVAANSPARIRTTALSVLGVTTGLWVVAALVTGALLDISDLTAVGVTAASICALTIAFFPRGVLLDKHTEVDLTAGDTDARKRRQAPSDPEAGTLDLFTK